MIVDKKEALEKVAKNCSELMHVSDELKADREIVLAAIAQNPFALKYASDELQKELQSNTYNRTWYVVLTLLALVGVALSIFYLLIPAANK